MAKHDKIPDSVKTKVIGYYTRRKLSQKQIAAAFCISQTSVSNIITDYLKKS